MLLHERFNESEDRPNVEPAISLLFVGDVWIPFTHLGLQQSNIIDQKTRHPLQFCEPIIKIHSQGKYINVQSLRQITLLHQTCACKE